MTSQTDTEPAAPTHAQPTDTGAASAGAPPTAAAPADNTLELPFAWENGPADADTGNRDSVFRFPAADDPEPGGRRLLGMALYGTLLGVIGLAASVRGILAIMTQGVPPWYQPTLAAASLTCVGLVVAAFLSIHRRALPWILLLAATVPLTADVVATAIVL